MRGSRSTAPSSLPLLLLLAAAATLCAQTQPAAPLPGASPAAPVTPLAPLSPIQTPADLTNAAPATPASSPQASPAPNQSALPNVLTGLDAVKLQPDAAPDADPGADTRVDAPAYSVRPEALKIDQFAPGPNAGPRAAPTPELPAVGDSSPYQPPPLSPDAPIPSIYGGAFRDVTGLTPNMTQRPLGNVATPDIYQRKRVPPIRIGRVRFGVELTASTAYNNNVFGSTSNPKGDLISTIQPVLYMETGTKGTIRMLWTPTFTRYASNPQLNTANQSFLFSSRYRWTKLRVGLDAGYLSQTGLFLSSSSPGQSSMSSYFARINAGYPLTSRTELLVALNGNLTSSGGAGGKQLQVVFDTSLNYRYSPKLNIGTGLKLGYTTSSSGNQTYESFLLKLRYVPTAKLRISAEGGVQFRQTSTPTAGNAYLQLPPIFSVVVGYAPTAKTFVTFRVFREVSADTFNAAVLEIQTGAELALAVRPTSRMTIGAAIAAGNTENTTLQGVNQGHFNYTQANINVSYLLMDEVSFSVFNNLQQRLNDTAGSNYMSNTSGMSLGVQF